MIDKIYYLIKDVDNNILASKVDSNQELFKLINEKNQLISYQNITYRVGIIKSSSGVVLAYTSAKDLIKSSKSFSTYISVLSDSTQNLVKNKCEIEEVFQKQINILVHNLISLNAHNLQEIYNIIPQEKVVESIGNQIEYVKSTIRANPDKTAKAFLKFMKNNIAMKSEFSVFAKLYDENPNLSIRQHNIHRVLMNILYSFFPDFTDKHVHVTVAKSLSKGYFDYESIYVAFFHLIENATKYIEEYSKFKIYFNESIDEVDVIFDMISLKIKETEKEQIFVEGYSGEFAIKEEKQGKGIGMSRVKKILELNNAKINLDIKNDGASKPEYQNNIFTIKIKKENTFNMLSSQGNE